MTNNSNKYLYNIGIYVRESRDENEENIETIETQKELLVSFVKEKNLGTIINIYTDDNISGAGFERSGINELKKDVKKGKINLIIIKDLSRLGRNNAKTLLFLDFLEEQGVRIITFDGRYDSNMDNETVGIDTWYNERYIRDISKKIRSNIIHKIKKGEYLGSAPYGYLKSKEKKNKLIIDKINAPVVKQIYKLYKQGYGYFQISKFLNSKKYTPPSLSYSGKWNPVAVQRIIKNRVYTGDTVQHVSEKISFKTKKTRRLPKEKWIITQDTHEAIISKEVFKEVQNIRKSRQKGEYNNKGKIHLFKSILYCGRCGSRLYARKRKNRPMGYICSKYSTQGKKSCSSHFINEKIIKDSILNDLSLWIMQDETEHELNCLINNTINRHSSIKNKLLDFRKKLKNIIRKQDILYMDKLEGRISNQLFERTNTYIEDSIKVIKSEINSLESIKDSSKEKIIKSFKKYIFNGNITNAMIKALVKKIIVFDPDDKFPVKLNGKEMKKAIKHGLVIIEYKKS